MKPMPPWIWMPSEAISTPTSVDQALATGTSSSKRRCSRASPRRPRSAATAAVPRIALAALQRELQRLLVGALRDGDALDPDAEARGVHHREHVRQALVRLADELG